MEFQNHLVFEAATPGEIHLCESMVWQAISKEFWERLCIEKYVRFLGLKNQNSLGNGPETGFEEVVWIGTGKSAWGGDRDCSRLTEDTEVIGAERNSCLTGRA